VITCRELIEFLDGYLADELSGDERAAFDEHLQVCPDCVAYMNGYEASIELGKAALRDDDAVPADVPDNLVKAILAARKRKR
jgi:anti-sigma factor RsiW